MMRELAAAAVDAGTVVGDLDEAAILAMLTRAFSVSAARAPGALGIGDDCAILPLAPGLQLLATTDALVAGTHFDGRWAEPRCVGQKALAVNVSDIAAMGGRPASALLALTLPPALSFAWLSEFADAFGRAAAAEAIDVVGGNLARGPAFSATVTLLGEVAAGSARTRSGARPGDRVCVTGALGGARMGLRTLARVFGGGEACADIRGDAARWSAVRELAAREPAVRAQLSPQARVRWGRTVAPYTSAMMDLSDGLTQDAARLAAASGVRLVLAPARVPRAEQASVDDALRGGEDYELLLTADSGVMGQLIQICADTRLPLTEIGVVEPGDGLWLEEGDGRVRPATAEGFAHFGATEATRGARA